MLKQDAEGIQNVPGVSLIGLIFIKWKQLLTFLRWGVGAPQTLRFCSGIKGLMSNKPVYKIKNKSKKHKNSI